MKKIIQKILTLPELVNKPPVLFDIGASGEIHKKWEMIAPYSVCIAFDADTRDFSLSEKKHSGYKKLFLVNRIVAPDFNNNIPFWLTKSPHCSSALKPNNLALKQWAFATLFEVEQEISLEAITLNQILHNCNLDYIDWYKSDSQGIDLRIFNSLDKSLMDKIIVAEFEPGILDAYVGEDKLSSLMFFMEDRPFWVENMVIKGSQRINEDAMNQLSPIQKKFIDSFIRTSPGWCEITYMNTFDSLKSKRDYLLGWLLSVLLKEYGFALKLAIKGENLYGEQIFTEMKAVSLNRIKKSLPHIVLNVLNRLVRKMFWKK